MNKEKFRQHTIKTFKEDTANEYSSCFMEYSGKAIDRFECEKDGVNLVGHLYFKEIKEPYTLIVAPSYSLYETLK